MKHVPTIILILIISLLFSIGLTDLYCDDENQKKGSLYLCLDNSASLRDNRFYEYIASQVIDQLPLIKRNYRKLILVLFGERGKLMQFEIEESDDPQWWEFSQSLGLPATDTTDFIPLLEQVLQHCSSADRAVILSDGEHDEEKLGKFSNFTPTEYQNLVSAFKYIENKNKAIFSIHLLNEESHFNASPIPIEKVVLGTVNNELKIAGITKSIMKKLGGNNTDHYRLCNTNEDAYSALFDFLDIKTKQSYNNSDSNSTTNHSFVVGISFDGIPPEIQNRVRSHLTMRDRRDRNYCIHGINWKLILNEGELEQADLKVKIKSRRSATVDVYLEDKLIMSGTSSESDFEECLVQEITKKASDKAKFSISPGYLHVIVPDPHIFAFIDEAQRKLEGKLRGCNGEEETPFLDIIYPYKNGFLIQCPQNLKKFDLYLLNSKATKDGRIKLITHEVRETDFKYLSNPIKINSISLKTIKISFQEFLSKNPGILYIYAHKGCKGPIREISLYDPIFSFFEDFTYTFYYVPENVNDFIWCRTIDMESSFKDPSRLTNYLQTMTGTSNTQQFNSWHSCLDDYSKEIDKEKEKIVSRIVKSDIFFYIFYHLKEIKNDSRYKGLFLALLRDILKLEMVEPPFPAAKLYGDYSIRKLSPDQFLNRRIEISDLTKIKIIADGLSKYEPFFINCLAFFENKNVETPWFNVISILSGEKK
ncbi:MAG: hypothetical protein MUF15_04120 [Acidobacteria bacterium]|nr:hypothetical protein [Acidobacteriota bacterium]